MQLSDILSYSDSLSYSGYQTVYHTTPTVNFTSIYLSTFKSKT